MYPIFIDEINQILQTYKTNRSDVEQKIETELAKNLKLKELVNSEINSEHLKRTSLYKDFIKKIRKEIYYGLRTYRPSQTISTENKFEDIAKTHISTKERIPYLEAFNTQLMELLKTSENIIDVGGGLLPLIFPFADLPTLKNYIWVDKDKKAFETVLEFAKIQPKVKPFNYAIGEHDWQFYLTESDGIVNFDTALMIKLISVVARQEKTLLEVLAKVPAKQILITASKEAMAKHQNIEARENKTLLNFIELTGRTIVNKFDIENEFGYLIK